MNAFDAARTYLSTLPPAISGAGGHPATFRAACAIVRFGLGDSDALALLGEFNRRCQPPWSEKELAHKLADARREAGGQARSFRQAPPAIRTVWKIRRKTPVQATVELVKVITPPNRETFEPIATAEPAPSVEPLPGEPSKQWHVRPGAPIPAQFLDVLRTWPAFRQHPAWRNHPQLTSA